MKMKMILMILGVVVLIGVVWFGARWAYYIHAYSQYWPATDITVNGVEREYHYFIPSNPPDGPLSLLVILPGGSAGAWMFPQQSLFEELAETEGIVLAFAIGKRLPDNEGAWQLNTDAQSMQDIDFITAMIDDISAGQVIDPSRVYAIGYSLGSMFSYELACHMSTRFAAIASFAGTMPVAPKSCEPERNLPIMHLHGVEDPIIAYNNTWDWKAWDSVGTMWDIPGLVQYWGEKYDCQNRGETESDTSTHIVLDQCEEGARFEHHRIEAGTHEWPESINGESTHRILWSFLSRFSMP